jgi:hypothetical protein
VNILLYAFLAIFLLLALLRLTWEKINPERTSPSDNYNLYLAYLMVGDQQKANYYKVLSGK